LCPCEPAPHGGKMKFQVGRFTCELSLDDNGEVQAQWLPWQPKYLNSAERVQYQAGRAAFLNELPRAGETDGRAATSPVTHGNSRPTAIRSR
jgi:hypothetical protein